MTNFKLSEGIDNNKIFLVKRSALAQRIDPYYYKEVFHKLRQNLINKGFIPLGYFVNSWNRGDGPRDGYYTDDGENGVYFLRVNNLKNNTISLVDVKYINRAIHETKLKRTQVSAGDVVFAISGTKDNLGTVSVIPENIKEANLNSALVRFDLNEEIDKKFFCILFDLNFIRTQIEFTGNGAAQNNLNNNEICSFLLPKLNINKQKELVVIYEDLKIQSEEKQQQAQDLLASIDTYLLTELGITLPEQDNSLEKRIFTVPFSEIIAKRIDPDYRKISYKNLMAAVQASHFKTVTLKDIVTKISSGKTPASSDYSETATIYPIIKVGSYSKELIDLSKVDYALIPQPLTAQKGDIFVLSAAHQSEYIGKHIKYLNEEPTIKTSFVGELICIRTNEHCNSIYLFSLLSLDIFKTLINREKTGQTSHVYGKDIKFLQIPLPPIQKQNEIAEHIQAIRTQAKQLQTQAEQLLANAKAHIEQMILG